MAQNYDNKIEIEVGRRNTLTGLDWEEENLGRKWNGSLANEKLCRAIIEVIDHYNNSDGKEREEIIECLKAIAKE